MKFYALTGVCLISVLLGGCSGDDSSSPTAASGATSPGSSSTNAPASTATQGSAGQAKVPGDACALLTIDEVRKLAPTAGDGKKTSQSGAPGQSIVSCRWEWPEGISTLDVRVSTLPAGVSIETVKLSLRAEAKTFGREVSGVGDFATVTSAISVDAEVKVLVKGLLLDIDLNGVGAKDKQDQVIALAKAAAARI